MPSPSICLPSLTHPSFLHSPKQNPGINENKRKPTYAPTTHKTRTHKTIATTPATPAKTPLPALNPVAPELGAAPAAAVDATAASVTVAIALLTPALALLATLLAPALIELTALLAAPFALVATPFASLLALALALLIGTAVLCAAAKLLGTGSSAAAPVGAPVATTLVLDGSVLALLMKK